MLGRQMTQQIWALKLWWSRTMIKADVQHTNTACFQSMVYIITEKSEKWAVNCFLKCISQRLDIDEVRYSQWFTSGPGDDGERNVCSSCCVCYDSSIWCRWYLKLKNSNTHTLSCVMNILPSLHMCPFLYWIVKVFFTTDVLTCYSRRCKQQWIVSSGQQRS